ncbi:MafI family immunity protein [Kiloniella antarctica]|uniref:MafI family immunity protein n=1 Tax=Kiloniella antarctica TaxID=1550907 RepID=A0ABW5BJX3_9PROT
MSHFSNSEIQQSNLLIFLNISIYVSLYRPLSFIPMNKIIFKIMDRHRNSKISKQIYEQTEHLLPKDIKETIHDYIYKYNEWGLGMETLVDALLEDDISITSEQKIVIVKAMEAMQLDRGQENLILVENNPLDLS